MSSKASTVTAIWAALPYPAFVLDPANEILAANSAAHQPQALAWPPCIR